MKLFQQYEQDIYRMAFVYVKNKEDALDVVQEVAYQSFKKIHTLKNPEYFKTWLIRITINCSTNVLRLNNKVVHLRGIDESLTAKDEDIALSISLRDLIQVLDEHEKSIVMLRFYHNHTFKEAAEIMNIPVGTAKSVLYRALGKLRKKLKEDDICER